MSFTTVIFLFLFFPVCTVVYFLTNRLEHTGKFGILLSRLRFCDIVLILLSLLFYSWTFTANFYCILIYIFAVYLLSYLSEWNVKTIITGIGIAAVTLLLLYFKFPALISSAFAKVFRMSSTAPLGISFITFSAISYLADTHRGKAERGSLIDCALYISFFPKLISGPIVLWQHFHPQIRNRSLSLENSVHGLELMIIGFAKKVLIADILSARMLNMATSSVDCPTAWCCLIWYTLQIYFDFSGYSDIAAGLASLFGFRFDANFNFPYLSSSVTEFWRRWHISLGSWFREYVYIPLGGNRKGMTRTLMNLGIVFLLTGMWHGSTKVYLFWGAANGAIVILERILSGTAFYKRIPKAVRYALTMLSVSFLWLCFRFPTWEAITDFIRVLFGIVRNPVLDYTWRYYLDASTVFVTAAGIFFATIPGLEKVRSLYSGFAETKTGAIVTKSMYLVLFAVCVIFMVSSSYSPFIYFRY